MDKQRDGQRNMVNAVLAVMAAHAVTWKNKSGITAAVATITAHRDDIDLAQKEQARPLAPITVERRALRKQSTAHTIAMAALLRQIATNTNDTALLQAAQLSTGDLARGRQSFVLSEAERIETVAKPHAAAIKAAGDPSDDALAELSATVKAYRVALETKREVVVTRSSKTLAIHTRSQDALSALRELDRLMQRLRVSEPEFYQLYRQARQNVEPGPKKAQETAAATTAPTPEAKAA